VAGSTVCTKAGGTTLDSPPRGLQHMQLHQGRRRRCDTA
jgi:hypothetical protein